MIQRDRGEVPRYPDVGGSVGCRIHRIEGRNQLNHTRRHVAIASMNGLLSAGVFALAYVAGHWAIGGALAPRLRRSLLARHALALVLGIALLTPPLVLLAATGVFRVSWLGAFGWIAAIGTIPSLVARNKPPGLRAQLDSSDLFALAAAIIFAVIAATGRDETLGAGRDQQVYAEQAVATFGARDRLSNIRATRWRRPGAPTQHQRNANPRRYRQACWRGCSD